MELDDYTGTIADSDRTIRRVIVSELERLDIVDTAKITQLVRPIKQKLALGETLETAAFTALLESIE